MYYIIHSFRCLNIMHYSWHTTCTYALYPIIPPQHHVLLCLPLSGWLCVLWLSGWPGHAPKEGNRGSSIPALATEATERALYLQGHWERSYSTQKGISKHSIPICLIRCCVLVRAHLYDNSTHQCSVMFMYMYCVLYGMSHNCTHYLHIIVSLYTNY